MSNELDVISSVGSERNIISIIFKNNNKIVDADTKGVTPSMFTVEMHKFVYMAMTYLYAKGLQINPQSILEVTVNEKAKELLDLEYLDTLANSFLTDKNFDLYVNKVKQSYIRRNLYTICEEERSFLLSEKSEVLNEMELISHIEERITSMNDFTSTNDNAKVGVSLKERLQERLENPSQAPGLLFGEGWEVFDRATGGGRAGDCIVVCARPKTGKSQLLRAWAEKVSIVDGLPVLYIDTEMDTPEQEDRMLASLSGVPVREIETGLFGYDTVNGSAAEKTKQINMATKMIEEGDFYHIYAPTFSIEWLKSTIKKYRIKHNIQAVFFDYIKMPSSSKNDLKSAQEWQMLGYTTTALKEVAGELGIPIYTACQENRSDVKGTEKDASNIGASDRILHYATKVMFLYNKSPEQIAKEGMSNGTKQIKIMVQRNGDSDLPPINLDFDGSRARIREVKNQDWSV